MSNPGKIIDATLPSSLDAEKAVLGAMILSPQAVDVAAQILKPLCFYHKGHKELFEAICAIHESGTVIDYTTLIDEIARRRQMEEVGGPAYIASLEQSVFSVDHVDHHANIVLEKHTLRELVRVTQSIRDEAINEREGVGEILDRAEKLIFDLSEHRTARDFVPIGSVTQDTMEEIERRSSSSHEVSGVATGYPELDEWTGGFQPSDLLILAARPSMGKTAFALNIALHVGAGLKGRHLNPKSQRAVGIFSLEMSASQINQRMLSTLSHVPMQLMRSGKLTHEQKLQLFQWVRQLHDVPIFIDDTPNISVLELRAKARRLASQADGLSLLMVDYLQLMRGSGGRSENRQQEISEITRSLKALARELNVPILALSQLSRLIEQRKGKQARPMLSDLRESGAIEQDADVVMFIHREKTYEKLEDDELPPTDEALLIIGKQRNGPIGDIDLMFVRKNASFYPKARGGQDIPEV
jgi:replicative DNA helicase